ncbi:(2Fe-2S)-binding protein [Methylocaldum sp. MU1018]
MYICICKKVTDRQIRQAVQEQEITNMRGLRAALGACDQCGKCAVEAARLMRECLHGKAASEHNPRRAA